VLQARLMLMRMAAESWLNEVRHALQIIRNDPLIHDSEAREI